MKINWLKLDINILNNEKITLIRKYPDGDTLVVLWLGLLCLAMKSDIPGHILICRGSPYSPDDISSLLGIEIKTVKMGLELFQRFGMIDIGEYNSIEVLRFAEYQSLEEIAQKREATRLRVAKHRESRRLEEGVTRYNVTSNAIEKRREDKRREDKSNKGTSRFQKPTLDELNTFVKEENLTLVDTNYFISYYDSNGWKVGRNNMKDWRATARNWHSRKKKEMGEGRERKIMSKEESDRRARGY